MEPKIYYAKSKRANGTQPTVAQHIGAVAKLAFEFGEPIGIGEPARLAGLMHDFGKYSYAFQQVLQNQRHYVDHASSSAVMLWQCWKAPSDSAGRSVIEAVNGHHFGLVGSGELYPLLRQSLLGDKYLTVNGGKTPALNGKEEYAQAALQFRRDYPGERLPKPSWDLPSNVGNLETMLYTRMLFSCLVDADYSVSAWEDDPEYFQNTEAPPADFRICLEKLYAFRDKIRSNSNANSDLNKMRNLVFDQCGRCGEKEPSGLFTLTAPTGTGKTLALLHFALRHALATGKQRIIIVLPFLTLAEQNALTYQQILPSVLIDHSQSRLPEEMREFTAKWNSPFIITTSVKFFETLFSEKPSDCRKLHNLAQSIVVFDEAQSLPPHLTGATINAVKELCLRYQMTMVFSTATQPDFDAIPNLDWKPREILPDNATLYRQLQRVNVQWELNDKIPPEEIASRMLAEQSVCSILNLRRHARMVFDILHESDPDSAFLISTDLCPAHRTEIVRQIHQRLAQGKPCRVAATQCIEAGVDLDFPILYRALAPLDSIIQAAGRCNRNGKLHRGQVIVFEPDDKRPYPDAWYQNAASIVAELLSSGSLDISDPGDINRYYKRLFSDAMDKPELTAAIQSRDYQKVGEQYRLIPDAGEKVIVPYSGLYTEYVQLKEELLEHGITPGLMKRAAPLTITVFDKGNLVTYAERIMVRCNGHTSDSASGYWILREQYEKCYSESGGLFLPVDGSNMQHFEF